MSLLYLYCKLKKHSNYFVHTLLRHLLVQLVFELTPYVS